MNLDHLAKINIHNLAQFLALLKEYPELNLELSVNDFKEAVSIAERFSKVFDLNPIAQGFSALTDIRKKIELNNTLGIEAVRTTLIIFLGQVYYQFLVGNISYGEFVSGMLMFFKRYMPDNSFDAFWESMHLNKIFIYSKYETEISIEDKLIEKDRTSLIKLSQKFKKGDEIVANLETDRLVELIYTLNIIPAEDARIVGAQDVFNELDERFAEFNKPSSIKVESVADLIEVYDSMILYFKILFDINVILIIFKKPSLMEKHISGELEPRSITNAIISRFRMFRNEYIHSLHGVIRFDESHYYRLVRYYFSKKSKKVSTEDERQVVISELKTLCERFPQLNVSELIKEFAPEIKDVKTSDEQVTQIENQKQDATSVSPEVVINGGTAKLGSQEFMNALGDLISSRKDLDKNAILERLRRKNIWEEYVINLTNCLNAASDNLESIRSYISRSNGRIVLLSKHGDNITRGGDRAIVTSKIDDGKGKQLCAIVFVVEFTEEGNKIELLVKNTEEVSVRPGHTGDDIEDSIDMEVEEKQKTISDIPLNILNFLRENTLPDFDFEIETDNFPNAVAFYIAYLLAQNPTYRNEQEKLLIEHFLKMCIENSRLKDAIVIFLAQLVSENQINIHFGDNRNPKSVLTLRPRIIARNIFNYLARKETSSRKEYDNAFTDEADVIFEGLGKPDKKTATKEWISEGATRIHLCYVNGKLEIAITWNYHP